MGARGLFLVTRYFSREPRRGAAGRRHAVEQACARLAHFTRQGVPQMRKVFAFLVVGSLRFAACRRTTG